MSKKGDVHVVFDHDSKNWRVEVTGQQRASGLTDIHNKDGQISGRDSEGHDPYPPRG